MRGVPNDGSPGKKFISIAPLLPLILFSPLTVCKSTWPPPRSGKSEVWSKFWGLHHTSKALYFYEVSKKSLHKSTANFGKKVSGTIILDSRACRSIDP